MHADRRGCCYGSVTDLDLSAPRIGAALVTLSTARKSIMLNENAATTMLAHNTPPNLTSNNGRCASELLSVHDGEGYHETDRVDPEVKSVDL